MVRIIIAIIIFPMFLISQSETLVEKTVLTGNERIYIHETAGPTDGNRRYVKASTLGSGATSTSIAIGGSTNNATYNDDGYRLGHTSFGSDLGVWSMGGVASFSATPISGAGVRRSAYYISDSDNDYYALSIQAGATATQRKYIEFLDHDGIRSSLLGSNLTNALIYYDSNLGYHPLIAGGTTSPTRLNGNPTSNNPVAINWDSGQPVSSGGFAVYDGSGISQGAANTYFSTNSFFSAFYSPQTYFYHNNNTDVLTINTASNGRSIIESTMRIDVESPIGIRFSQYGAGNRSIPVSGVAYILAVQANGEVKELLPPLVDGTYQLTVTVVSGSPTYSWQ